MALFSDRSASLFHFLDRPMQVQHGPGNMRVDGPLGKPQVSADLFCRLPVNTAPDKDFPTQTRHAFQHGSDDTDQLPMFQLAVNVGPLARDILGQFDDGLPMRPAKMVPNQIERYAPQERIDIGYGIARLRLIDKQAQISLLNDVLA
jgi:hypothetical protein